MEGWRSYWTHTGLRWKHTYKLKEDYAPLNAGHDSGNIINIISKRDKKSVRILRSSRTQE